MAQTTTAPQVLEIKLDLIDESPSNPRKYYNPVSLNELAQSIIRLRGVMQAILLRPHPAKKGRYECVFGHRRLRASKLAKKETIPATIRTLTDDEVQDIQFTENLNRDDVHPMDEAFSFHGLVHRKVNPITAEEIGVRIGKSITYVLQRLVLISLIEPLQKKFWENKFYMAHAVQIARLQPEGQKLVNGQGDFGSPAQLASYIERNIMRKLSDTLFKKDDATLLPAAGACTTCTKRTGAAVLFDTDAKNDRCLDGACFALKNKAWIQLEAQLIIQKKPEVIILCDNHKTVPPALMKAATDAGVSISTRNNNSIQSGNWSGYKIPVQVFHLDGYNAGKYEKWFKKPSIASSSSKNGGDTITAQELQLAVSDIKEKMKRGLQLDFEKEQVAIKEAFVKKFGTEGKIISENDITFEATAAIEIHNYAWWVLMDIVNYFDKDEPAGNRFGKLINEPSEVTHITNHEKATILKDIFFARYSSRTQKGAETTTYRLLADFLGINIAEIEAEQHIVREKREKRLNDRIAEKQDQLKTIRKLDELPAKLTNKKAPKKTAKTVKKKK